MKKRFLCILLVCLLGITGCGNTKEKRENQDAYRQIGINCMNEGKYEDAIEAFQKALDQSLAKIGEMEIDTCYYKAEAQYLAGKTADAIDTYTALLAYDEKNADAYYLRGTLYLANGQREEAKQDFEAAVKNDKKSYERYVAIATQLRDYGEEEQADAYLADALKLGGKSAEDYTWRGRIYMLCEDYENAQKELEQAKEKESENADLYLGELYEKLGDSKKAEESFDGYIKEHEEDTQALESLADIAMGKENYAKAVSYLELALKVDKPVNEQMLRRKLIQAYEFSGNFAAAKEQMKIYAAAYPQDEEAVREAEFLQSR